MTYKKITFFAAVFSIFLPGGLSHGGEVRTMRYEEVTEGEKDTCDCVLERTEDGYRLTVIYSDEIYAIETDSLFSVERCDITNKKTSDTILCRRQGDKMIMEDGGAVREENIGDLSWYQTQFALAGFILSKQRKTNFVQATLYQQEGEEHEVCGSALKMVAKKEKGETINVAGRQVETVRTTITLPGLKSLFWKITYWYRISDGLVVRYEDVRGGPGTPKTIGTLIYEEVKDGDL